MATNTAAVLPPARQDPRQVLNTLTKTINWNDAGVADGVAFDNSLPQGAQITDVLVDVVTAFNGTTPSLVVGTVSTAYTTLVAAADVDETAIGVTRVNRAIGGSLARSADVTPYAKLTLTSATAGQAIITICFTGGYAT